MMGCIAGELFRIFQGIIKNNFWMVRMRPFYPILILCVWSSARAGVLSSDTSTTSVSVRSILGASRIPLNRTVDFTVRVSWEGRIESVEIGDVENPVFSNLDAVASESTNRVSGTSSGQTSVKEIVYSLRPKTLGMAYVEPVALSYVDKATGLKHFLRTRRMAVEILPPVSERTGVGKSGLLILSAAAFLSGIAAGVFLFLRRRRIRLQAPAPSVQPILEEAFLEQLKQSVDCRRPDRKESFAALSRLFRRYLIEKHQLAASGATTEELLRNLKERNADEGLFRKSEMLFTRADVINFSGTEATPAELDDAYTVVETVLEAGLAAERARLTGLEREAANKKVKKWAWRHSGQKK